MLQCMDYLLDDEPTVANIMLPEYSIDIYRELLLLILNKLMVGNFNMSGFLQLWRTDISLR